MHSNESLHLKAFFNGICYYSVFNQFHKFQGQFSSVLVWMFIGICHVLYVLTIDNKVKISWTLNIIHDKKNIVYLVLNSPFTVAIIDYKIP